MYFNDERGEGSREQWLAYLLLDPDAPGLIPNIPKKFRTKEIADVAEVNQRRCLEESGLKMLIEHI